MQVTIKQSTIKAVSFAMAKNDIRYYLNGMLIQHNGAETRLVATDGHRLNIVVLNHPDAPVCDLVEAIIPDSLIKTICSAKAPRHDKRREVTLTIDGDKVSAILPDGTEAVAKLVDGKYPDYQRVIPESFTGEPASYNPEYLIDAHDAVCCFAETKKIYPEFKQSGPNVGGIIFDNFAAFVMPWRGTDYGKNTTQFKADMQKPEKIESAA